MMSAGIYQYGDSSMHTTGKSLETKWETRRDRSETSVPVHASECPNVDDRHPHPASSGSQELWNSARVLEAPSGI